MKDGTSRAEQNQNPRPRARRVWVIVAAACCVGGALWLALTVHRGWNTATSLLADLDEIEALAASPVDTLDPAAAVDLLHQTRLDVDAARRLARPFLPLMPHLGWVPRFGGDLQAAPDLLLIASELAGAGDDLASLFLPLLADTTVADDSGGDLVTQVLAALTASRTELQSARSAVRNAVEARARLDTQRLSPRVQRWVAKLDRYLPTIARAADAALVLPEMLGADGPRTYLLLVQNEDELRATGGFISAVAEVGVERGSIVDMRLEDSYAVDDFTRPYPEPPAALRKYMLADLWVFRDSNWSPDFPTSARAAIDLYRISRDTRLNGVIAIDQAAIRLLVDALAPLNVDGVDEPVTGENVIRYARASWSPGIEGASQEWWLERKQFMADVLAAAQRRAAQNIDRPTAVRLARSMWKALLEKHVLAYLVDVEAAAVVSEGGWDGAVRADDGDFLMVVDSNVGFNKVNGLVEREIAYTVDLRNPSHPTARLVVRYQNPGSRAAECDHESRYDASYEQMMERCYWNYLRVLVRQGTELVSATPHAVDGRYLISGEASPAEVVSEPPEGGRSVLATFLLVPIGEEREMAFDLDVQPQVIRSAEGGSTVYTLTLQKQPGTSADRVRLAIALPSGARLLSSNPPPTEVLGATAEFDLQLNTDISIRLVYQ